ERGCGPGQGAGGIRQRRRLAPPAGQAPVLAGHPGAAAAQAQGPGGRHRRAGGGGRRRRDPLHARRRGLRQSPGPRLRRLRRVRCRAGRRHGAEAGQAVVRGGGRGPDGGGHPAPGPPPPRGGGAGRAGHEQRAPPRPARQVLITGASGGAGSCAVQIAKADGAAVTAVTSTGNLELARSLGADEVVDYTTTDVTRDGRRYDLILDTVGNRSVPELRRALAPGGKDAVTGVTRGRGLPAGSLRGGKDITQVQAHVTAKDLELLSELIEAGKVRPRIDRRYAFAGAPAPIAYLEEGHAKAKVVVTMP